MVADVWKKDVWEFQARSGSSGSCSLFLHFLGKIAVQEMSGKTPGSPKHPSSRHPWPSDRWPGDSRESIRRKTSIITSERFARIASNLRFEIFTPLKRDSQKKGFSSGALPDSRKSANRFGRIRPSKHWSGKCKVLIFLRV